MFLTLKRSIFEKNMLKNQENHQFFSVCLSSFKKTSDLNESDHDGFNEPSDDFFTLFVKKLQLSKHDALQILLVCDIFTFTTYIYIYIY